MKPASFDYHRPLTVDEAVDLLDRHSPEAKVLAGGQSLIPLMNFRLARPAVVVDMGSVQGLNYMRQEDGRLSVGALTRQSELEDSPLAANVCPLAVEAIRLVGHRTIRNRGTIGGSVAHADPSAELPAVLVALEGEVRATSTAGERLIPAEELFITVCMTSLAPNELITEVRLPALPPATGSSFLELSKRRGDYALAGVAATFTFDGGEICADVRLALAGVDQTPVRCRVAEEVVRWNAPTDEVIREAAHQCAEACEPQDDYHATAAYKRAMIAVLTERALRESIRRARRS